MAKLLPDALMSFCITISPNTLNIVSCSACSYPSGNYKVTIPEAGLGKTINSF